MEMLQIALQAVTTVGFPIVTSGACFWLIVKNNEEHRKDIAEINAQHSEEIKEINALHREESHALETAINNNTVALTKLSERIGNNNE